MTFWPIVEPQLHPQDRPAPATWERCYDTKFALAQLIRPSSILEIGVRAGYSALAFLTACPEATYVGLDTNSDTHGGFRGAIEHARRLLAPFDATVLELSSTQYAERLASAAEPPAFDLIHVDGDHSAAWCLGDLEFAARFRPRVILVDDVLGLPEVRAACDWFRKQTESSWLWLVIPDGHHGIGLLQRNPLAETSANSDQRSGQPRSAGPRPVELNGRRPLLSDEIARRGFDLEKSARHFPVG